MIASAVPVPGSARMTAMAPARRVEPRRAARRVKWELQRRQLDGRGDRRTPVAQDLVAVFRKTREWAIGTSAASAVERLAGARRA
jgi:hypothetical protein